MNYLEVAKTSEAPPVLSPGRLGEMVEANGYPLESDLDEMEADLNLMVREFRADKLMKVPVQAVKNLTEWTGMTRKKLDKVRTAGIALKNALSGTSIAQDVALSHLSVFAVPVARKHGIEGDYVEHLLEQLSLLDLIATYAIGREMGSLVVDGHYLFTNGEPVCAPDRLPAARRAIESVLRREPHKRCAVVIGVVLARHTGISLISTDSQGNERNPCLLLAVDLCAEIFGEHLTLNEIRRSWRDAEIHKRD